MKYIYGLVVLILLSACSSQDTPIPEKIVQKQESLEVPKEEFISDLKNIPQNIEYYTKEMNFTAFDSSESFDRNYFKPWNIDKMDTTLEDAMWAYNSFKVGNSYGENLQLLDENFFTKNLENSNFKAYSTVNKQAVSLKELNIRAFPTNRPLLLDPARAGEGFPFDYLQNSIIAANKPLFISHYSQDKEWAFIKCSFTYGWVKARDIVVIEKKYTDIWQKAEQIFITKEGVTIESLSKDFLFKSRVGMMFPLIKEGKNNYTVLLISSYKNNKSLYMQAKIPKKIAHKGVLAFNGENLNSIINEVSKTNYGWGGLYSQRDCSSTLRDIYIPFGLWLPRNSYQQSRMGSYISIKEDSSGSEKIALIKENTVPFKTLLYKKGHIVLYVGEINGEIIVYHNTWAIKMKKDNVEGRFIVGKPIFSTLRVGENLQYHDKNALIIKKLVGMTKL